MSLEVEVVSDSERARKDLKALEDAINNIKKVAANFSFNPFSEKNRENTKKAAEDLDKLKENSKAASTHFSKLVPDAKAVSESIKNASQHYEKIAKHADSISRETKNINNGLKETNKQSSALEKTTNAATDAFKGLVAQIGATAAAYLSMKTYLSATDTTVSISSKISVATATQSEFNKVLKETRNIAIGTRGGLVEITDLYTKLNLATKNFNRSQEDVGRVTSTVAKAVALSGSSTESAAAAIMQLGQAFSSGILQGDELRSISENASQLMQTIADGFGKTIGQVRQLGAEGKLTSDKLFQSILSQTEAVNGKFSKVGITFSQAFTNISSSTLILLAEIEKVLSGGGSGGKGGAKGLPFYINNIALEIAKFAENIGFNITLLKVKAFLLLVDIRKFLSEPFDIKLKTVKLAVEDILPSQSEIYNTLTSAITNAKHFMSTVMGAVTPTRKASGGYISGPGTGTSDSIPAMLSNGEFVVNAEATRKNLKLLSLINSGAVKHFAKGGSVDSSSSNAENWLYRSVPPKPSSITPLPVAVVSQNPEVTQVRETLLFDRIQDSLVNFFKQAAANIKKVTDPTFARVGDGLDSFISKLEKWVPGLARAIDIFKSLSGLGPYTGGGPQRNSENRMLGHDVINTFIPVRAQIPVLATITAAAGGLIALSTSGTLRSVLLGLLTTAFGLAVGGTVYDSEIKRVNGILMKSGVDIVHAITNALFGSGIFGDRGFGGTLALIAKMSLLFAAGRSFMGNLAIGTLTAPTSLANATALAAQSAYAGRKTTLATREYESIEKLGVTLKERRDAALKELSSFRAIRNAAVGPTDARRIAAGQFPAPLARVLPVAGQPANLRQRDFLELSRAARATTRQFELFEATQKEQLKTLKGNVEALKSHSDGLKAAVTAQKENFRTGVINTAGAIGGTFGALGGFNLGTEIAKGMTGADEWKKVGVVIVTTMLGQALLAGAAAMLTTFSITILGYMAPFLLGIAGVTAVIGGLFYLYKNWDDVVTRFKGVLEDQLPRWVEISKKWIEDLSEWVADALGDTNYRSRRAAKQNISNITERQNAAETYLKDPLITAAEREQKEKELAQLRAEEAATRKRLVAFGGSVGYKSIDGTNPLIYSGAPTANRALAEENSRTIENIANAGRSIGNSIVTLFTEPAKILKVYVDAFLDVSTSLGRAAPQKRAFGGYISGPGTGTSDSIPALLSNGEFVVNANATSKNIGLLNAINSGNGVKRFAEGGIALKGSISDDILEIASKRIDTDGIIGIAMNAMKFLPKDSLSDSSNLDMLRVTLNNLLRVNTGFKEIPHADKKSSSFQATLAKPATAAYVRDGGLDAVFSKLQRFLVGSNETPEKIGAFKELKQYTKDAVKSELVSSLGSSLTLLVASAVSEGGAKHIESVLGTLDPLGGGYNRATDTVWTLKAFSAISRLLSIENQIPVLQGVSRGFRLSDKYAGLPEALSNILFEAEDIEVKSFTPIKQLFDKFVSFQDDEELSKAFSGQKPAAKYASGGYIRGPGTGTSDSIPAMLSNGEFVINAEAARRNFGILEAINNGKQIGRFAQGGSVRLSSSISAIAEAEAIAKGIESALVKAVIMVESHGNPTIKNPTSGAAGLMQLMEGTARDLKLVVNSTKDERLEAAKNVAAGTEYLKQQLKTFGTLDKALAAYNWGPGNVAKNLDAQGNIKRMPIETKEYIEAVRMYAGLPGMDKDYETFGVSRKVKSPWRGRTNQIEGNAVGGGMDWSVFPFGIGERLSKIDFSKWPGGELIIEAFSWIAKTFLGKAKIATDALDVLGGSRENAAKAINEIGFNGKEYKASDFNKLDKSDIDALRAAVTTIKAPKPPANDLEALENEAAVRAARLTITTILDKTEKAKPLSERLSKGSTLQAIETLNDAFRGNTQYLLGLTAYSKLSSDDMNRLITITEQVQEINQRAATLDEFGRDQANRLSKELWKHADEILSRVNAQPSGLYVERPSADALKAGTTFATSFQNEVTGALAQALKGKERFSSLGKVILERITGGILDNVSKGFINSLFAKTDLGDKLSKMITSIFTFGEKSGGGFGSLFNDAAEMLKGPQVTHGNVIDPKDAARYASAIPYVKSNTSDYEQTFSYDFTALRTSIDTGLSNVVSSVDTSGNTMLKGIMSLGSVFSSITTGIGTGISSFFSFLGFAEGGAVFGAGSGTSDSIPALLSNGEFVVNARATNKYRGLLESINSGTTPRFADGGFVANMSSLGILDSQAELQKANSNSANTSVFNINITGDISSQTRRQVLTMIPEIAAGTNAHNREINYNRK